MKIKSLIKHDWMISSDNEVDYKPLISQYTNYSSLVVFQDRNRLFIKAGNTGVPASGRHMQNETLANDHARQELLAFYPVLQPLLCFCFCSWQTIQAPQDSPAQPPPTLGILLSWGLSIPHTPSGVCPQGGRNKFQVFDVTCTSCKFSSFFFLLNYIQFEYSRDLILRKNGGIFGLSYPCWSCVSTHKAENSLDSVMGQCTEGLISGCRGSYLILISE